jgi:hypothetical protein
LIFPELSSIIGKYAKASKSSKGGEYGPLFGHSKHHQIRPCR